jgi:hypothetical protein
MATYTELFTQYTDRILLDRITIAIFIAADTVVNESPATTNHANRFIWASDAFNNAENYARRFLAAVLAANESATVSQIQNSTDAQIQNNVDAVVDVFAGI